MITAGSITANVATMTIDGGHPFQVGDTIDVTGITGFTTDPNLTGQTVTAVTTTTLSYALTGANENFTGFTDATLYTPSPFSVAAIRFNTAARHCFAQNNLLEIGGTINNGGSGILKGNYAEDSATEIT
jgi:hypothetical protein